ncbi:MAG: LLM class flavin-dependent oxidoreductase [Candidatus Dormibacteria bacterium]
MIAGPLGEARNAMGIAQAAETAGFELLGLGDNQSLWRDVYVSLTLAAHATSAIRLGTCVTNLVTRHPAVTASAIASVNELSDGRAFLGIGPGDSSVLNIGARAARLTDLEEGVRSIRLMLAGDEVPVDGGSMHVGWSKRPVPIFMSAEGPRALELAGRIADGVMVSYGLSAANVRAAEERIAAGAVAAGRDFASIEVWHAARVAVADSADDASRLSRAGMASVAHHALRLSPEARGVPADLVPAINELNARYRPNAHAQPGDSPNALLVEELGLMPYLTARYALMGTPEDCAGQLSALEETGIRRLLLMFSGTEIASQVRRFQQDILPHYGSSGSPLDRP